MDTTTGLPALRSVCTSRKNLLGSEHAAAGTVDAQNHRFDRIVVARLAQQIGGAFTADHARRLMAVENLAGSDHDADPGIGFGFQARAWSAPPRDTASFRSN